MCLQHCSDLLNLGQNGFDLVIRLNSNHQRHRRDDLIHLDGLGLVVVVKPKLHWLKTGHIKAVLIQHCGGRDHLIDSLSNREFAAFLGDQGGCKASAAAETTSFRRIVVCDVILLPGVSVFSITPQQINDMRNEIEDAFKRFARALRRPGKVHNHAFATSSSQTSRQNRSTSFPHPFKTHPLPNARNLTV